MSEFSKSVFKGLLYTILLLQMIFLEATASEPRSFDLNAGDAASTLKKFAIQANVDIVYDSRTLEGIQTPEVTGILPPDKALSRLLAGTGLTFNEDVETGAFAVIRFDATPTELSGGNPIGPANDNPNQLDVMTNKNEKPGFGNLIKLIVGTAVVSPTAAFAQQQDEQVYELSPFEVSTDTGNYLYSVDKSSGGTRVATSVRDLPFTLDILTVEYMDDFIMYDINDVLSTVANVSQQEPHTGAGSGNAIRGFAQFYQLRDGFYRNGVINKTLIDRVEVIKGPYAAIYGRSEPGGVVNYIPKRPIFNKNFGEVSFNFGENATYGVSYERNVAIGKKTAFLLGTSYNEREFDQIWTHQRDRDIGLSLSHQFTKNTKLSLEYEHIYRRNNRGYGLPDVRIDGTDPSDGTRNKRTGEWAWDFYEKYGWVNNRGPEMFNDRNLETYNVTLTHKFSDNIHARIAWNRSDTGQQYNYYGNVSNTVLVNPVTREFTRWNGSPVPNDRDIDADSMAIQADLNIRWVTGAINHNTLFTLDWQDTVNYRDSFQAPRGRASDPHTVDYPIDPNTGQEIVPNYAADGVIHSSRNNPIMTWASVNPRDNPEYYTRINQYQFENFEVTGLFMSHRMRFFDDKLDLMLGTRYDTAESELLNGANEDFILSVTSESKVSDWTYNMGANYKLWPGMILYVSKSTSFAPQAESYSHTGEPFPNITGNGTEIGFKASLFDGKADLFANYFEIERTNMPVPNPDFEEDVDDRNEKPVRIPGGLHRATGTEVTLNWGLTRNLSLRGSLGFLDAYIAKDLSAGLEGQQLRKTSKWNYNVQVSYRFLDGALEGLRLNASWQSYDDFPIRNDPLTPTDLRYNLRSQNYENLDLSASYSWKTGSEGKYEHRVTFAIKNTFDRIALNSGGYFTDGRQLHMSYKLRY